MSLITVEQLEQFMGVTFDDTQRSQAQMQCILAEAAISSITGVTFYPVDDDLISAQSDGHGIIELVEKPIRNVSSVMRWDSEDEDDCWSWDGMAGVYNLSPRTTYSITYSYGRLETPTDVTIVALGMCSRVMNNPAGLRQETVGAISVTYPGIGGEAGTINISNLEERILEKYTTTEWSYRNGISKLRERNLPILTTYNNIQ